MSASFKWDNMVNNKGEKTFSCHPKAGSDLSDVHQRFLKRLQSFPYSLFPHSLSLGNGLFISFHNCGPTGSQS